MSTPTLAGSFDDQLSQRLLFQRIVVLGQEVDDAIANRICAQMLLLAAEDPVSDIALHINSPGGSITAGMAILDTMQYVECDVATFGLGMAASMGQFLLTAGTRGKRYVLPHARVMMHQPSSGVGGAESDITIQAERLRRLKREMNEMNARHSGQPLERIEADAERDRWFTAAEARDYGLVDHVVRRAAQVP